eukprot:gb/GECG01012792.1/.p1 GENE.gb/GECG01012792.1/~~gb/GECG01012792.1/.p1  ORF type:complete len:203 (+),score=5.71 gb/GECG01012792.1/:1-609(+)
MVGTVALSVIAAHGCSRGPFSIVRPLIANTYHTRTYARHEENFYSLCGFATVCITIHVVYIHCCVVHSLAIPFCSKTVDEDDYNARSATVSEGCKEGGCCRGVSLYHVVECCRKRRTVDSVSGGNTDNSHVPPMYSRRATFEVLGAGGVINNLTFKGAPMILIHVNEMSGYSTAGGIELNVGKLEGSGITCSRATKFSINKQ